MLLLIDSPIQYTSFLTAHCESLSDARSVGHEVRNRVLLDSSGEQVRPRTTGIHRNIFSSMALGWGLDHARVLESDVTAVHLLGINPTNSLLDMDPIRRSIGVVKREIGESIIQRIACGNS